MKGDGSEEEKGLRTGDLFPDSETFLPINMVTCSTICPLSSFHIWLSSLAFIAPPTHHTQMWSKAAKLALEKTQNSFYSSAEARVGGLLTARQSSDSGPDSAPTFRSPR